MTILKEALDSLIREAWNKEKVEKEREMFKNLPLEEQIAYAIKNVRRIHFKYDDEQGGGGKNFRYILPVAMGKSKAGNLVFRAFQTMGSTKRGNQKWKLFRVDRVKTIHDWDFNLSTRNFKAFKGQLDAMGLHSPDRGMSVIYEVSPLCSNQNISIADINKPIDSNPITKQDIQGNASVEKQNKQEKTIDNVIGTDDINNRIYAPETVPVTKDDISVDGHEQNTDAVEEPKNNNISTYTDEPVTKQEIEDPKNNGLTRAFNDMMQRWNKLERGEDEEEETEEDGRII